MTARTALRVSHVRSVLLIFPCATPRHATLTSPRATAATIPQRVKQHHRDDRAVKHKTSQPQCPVALVIAHSVWQAICSVRYDQCATRLHTAAGIEVAIWLRVLRLFLEEGPEARHVAFGLAS
jgi:hypothetical protein